MFSDLTTRSLNSREHGDLPFTFFDQGALNTLTNITAIDLIENGDRSAREAWQNRRLTTLLRHAQTRSAFWRQRLPSRRISYGDMKYVPVQSRRDITAQVNLEGSLAGDGNNSSYSSTGSTGAPVKVFLSPENAYYNLVRSLAQYFINGLSLEYDRVQIAPPFALAKLNKKLLPVETADTWIGELSKIFRSGTVKRIIHQFDDDALIAELVKRPFGYLVCPNRYMDILIDHGGAEFVKSLGVNTWMHTSDYRDPKNVAALTGAGIRCLSNYSAGELGAIAFECSKCPEHFHVTHSNVIVECDNTLTVSMAGKSLGRLLITHLHSYATPIIRYDIGDFGQLDGACPCGHDGPTLSNIYGRGKHFLRHPDGRLLHFHLSTRTLLEIVEFTECRFRQDAIDTITVELGGRESLTAEEEANLRSFIIRATDPAFKVEIKPVKEIDWSANPKQLFFSSAFA